MRRFILVLLMMLPCLVHAQKQGQERVDSLLQELGSERFKKTEDTEKARLLTRLAFSIRNIDPDRGVKYAGDGLKLSEKLGWKQGIALAYNSLYANYSVKSNYQEALDFCTKSLKIFEELGDKKGIAANLGNIAECYNALGNYEKALDYESKELKIAEEMNNSVLIADCNINIASTYMLIRNFLKAREYLSIALKLEQQLGDKQQQASCLLALGSTYYNLEDYQKALENILDALKLYELLGDRVGIQGAYSAAAGVYNDQRKYLKALEFKLNSLKMSEEIGNRTAIAASLNDLALIYLKMAQDSTVNIVADSRIPHGKNAKLDKAIEYLSRSSTTAREIGDIHLLVENYKNLVKVYRTAKKYDLAIVYMDSTYQLFDTMFSLDASIKLARLGMQRETDLKQKQIEINGIQEKQKRDERIFFIIGIGLLLLLIVLVLRNYSRQKQTNSKLSMANSQLEDEKLKSDELMGQQKVLLQRQDELVHEQYELLHQKDELMGQLATNVAMKSKFLANISHELRTPITLLTGMLEMIKVKSQTGSSGNQEKLEAAYKNSMRLQYMVEELLDLSRLESSGAAMKIETKEITPVLKRMVYAFETFMQKEQLSLHYDDGRASGLHVSLDENKFEKIINNLVYNAIKFNRKGGYIKVVTYQTDDEKSLIIEVADSGNGIHPGDLPYIFERYYQSDSSGAKAQGVGIGLSLVHEFTNLLGGSVTVASLVGEGTTFTLQFPLVEKGGDENACVDETTMMPAEVWEHFPERQTVLIVEDNSEMRYYLKEILGGKVNLAEAGNGREALLWLEKNTPDLIISDMMMPEMDGREFIAHIKNTEALRKIPVITLTALADQESQLGMLRMGVDDYIVKPFNASELSLRVYNLLNNYAERKAFNLQPADPEDIPAESKEADELRNKITEYVLARLKNTNVSVFDLAYELSMSERQLYRLAKSLTGCTPAHLIKEVRLQKAYELLVSGQIYKIDDVAKRVGFETPAYFARQFMERFGKKPGEFF